MVQFTIIIIIINNNNDNSSSSICTSLSLQTVSVSKMLLAQLGTVTGQTVVSLGGRRHLLVKSEMLHTHL